MLRSSSPGASTLRLLAVTKSSTRTVLGAPCRGHSVHTPSSPAVSEIIGPAGSDMQILPPTVDAFQILNPARKLSQQCRNSEAACQSAGAVNLYSVAI